MSSVTLKTRLIRVSARPETGLPRFVIYVVRITLLVSRSFHYCFQNHFFLTLDNTIVLSGKMKRTNWSEFPGKHENRIFDFHNCGLFTFQCVNVLIPSFFLTLLNNQYFYRLKLGTIKKKMILLFFGHELLFWFENSGTDNGSYTMLRPLIRRLTRAC